MSNVIKTPQSLASDIGRMQRESAMVMATVASLADDELSKPTKCEGWTRAHVIAHLARGADAMTNLATWAVTGQETPAYESREKRDADIEAAAKLSATELAADLEQANARLLEAFQALKDGVRVATLPTLFSGEINAFSLPARRTTELIVHHDDLDTTWEWHEADPDAILDAIEVCVRGCRSIPTAPACRSSPARARSGSSATARTGSRATTRSCCRSWRVSRWKKVCSTRASCRSCPRGEAPRVRVRKSPRSGKFCGLEWAPQIP